MSNLAVHYIIVLYNAICNILLIMAHHPAPYTNIEDVDMNAEVYAEKDVPLHLQDKSSRFCLLSVVGPEGCGQKHKSMAIRVYGCKTAKQDANAYARKLPAKTGHFDILNVSCNNWIALPARLEGGQDERCVEERVDAIFGLYKNEEIANKEKLKRQLDKETRVEPPLKEKPDDLQLEFDTSEGDDPIPESTENVSDEVPEDVKDKYQKWTVLSVVAPEYPAGTPAEIAVRIYGCREREQDAKEWAKQLRESNPYFNVFVLENYQWATMPPDIGQISDVQSSDKQIQKLRDAFTAEELGRRKDQAKELDVMHRQEDRPVKIEQDTSADI